MAVKPNTYTTTDMVHIRAIVTREKAAELVEQFDMVAYKMEVISDAVEVEVLVAPEAAAELTKQLVAMGIEYVA
jgi:hypothetical protein